MTLDVISMITTDHRDVESLFDRLRQDPENRPALLAELAAKFVAHSRGEEELVYPEIAKAMPEEKQEVHHGAEEHHQAERILLRLLDTNPDTAEFETVLGEFVEAVTHHVQEEENEILPALAKALPRQRLEALGRAFSERKAQEIQIGLPMGNAKKAGRQRKTGTRRTAMAGLSREELYHRAQEADIPGRSSMTKEQLARALQKSGRA
ncbi:hemerythrin domain-containing protein [Streptosporangium sp. NPDC000396]|uniref:hemerythrin domain-containing protein n=1 Tax=Streptosporangium sp. NPDC000396 TaxID=3366185 RepID=UPI0036A0504A